MSAWLITKFLWPQALLWTGLAVTLRFRQVQTRGRRGRITQVTPIMQSQTSALQGGDAAVDRDDGASRVGAGTA